MRLRTFFGKSRRWIISHVYWPLLCRLYAGRAKRFRLPDGSLLDCPIDSSIAGALLMGAFENNERYFFQRVLQAGDVVFDIGANCGIYSIMAANKVGQDGRVYSFEPGRRELTFLRHNIALNRLTNIVVIDRAVSNTVETAWFAISKDGGLNSLRKNEHPAQSIIGWEKVETTSLDHFVQQHGISHVDFIKMDVEGAERLVFLGMRHLLESQSELIMLFESSQVLASPFGYHVTDFLSEIRSLGLQLFFLDGQILRKVEENNPQIGYEIYNFIAVKGDGLLRRGCCLLDNGCLGVLYS